MTSLPPSRQLHIHVAGPDGPGILAEAMGLIDSSRWRVVDIKQFVFNGLLNLSLFLEGNESSSLAPIKTAFNDFSQKTGLKVHVYPLRELALLDSPYKHRTVITVLGEQISAETLRELTRTFASLDINILRIEQLDSGNHHVMEFVIGTRRPTQVVEAMDELVRFKETHAVDIAVQEDTLFRRNKRLVVLDADMTFLQCEVIDELGKLAGVETEMKAITHRAMDGKMPFKSALKKRVALLKGLPVSKLRGLTRNLPLTPGAEEMVKILQHLGHKVAIVSGGFQIFIDHLKKKYGLDYGFANQLKIEDNRLTGELEGEIVDAPAKARILKSLARENGISLKQVAAVGDGANDIQMLAQAGLGIAFNAKPIVQKHARASINISDLGLILYFLGIDGKDLKELREIVKTAPRKRLIRI